MATRSLMLAGGTITCGLIVDFAVMLVTAIVLVIIAAKLYPRVAV
jgi:hypothetical protein